MFKGKPVDMMGDYRLHYKSKIRFAMLGPVAAGKSTIAAGFLYVCETLSALVGNFYCRVLPTSTHILKDANNLRLGQFPEKTDPLQARAPEAGFLLLQRGWREKKIQVPVCDVAGEISDYIHAEASGGTAGQRLRSQLQNVNQTVVKYVRDCQGYIIALAAPDALIFRERASTFDADAYVYEVMNDILEYRRQTHKPDPNIIVVLTKWDEVMDMAQQADMDVYDPTQDGMAKFLANGFPATSMLLKPMRDKGMVKFFRSWFKVKRRKDGTIECWPDTNKPKIEIIDDPDAYIRYRPSCSESDYIEMVRHIGSFGQ